MLIIRRISRSTVYEGCKLLVLASLFGVLLSCSSSSSTRSTGAYYNAHSYDTYNAIEITHAYLSQLQTLTFLMIGAKKSKILNKNTMSQIIDRV